MPELVKTDEDGVKSIDYIGFIPLLVESINEMRLTIQEQQNEIEMLQSLLSVETKSTLRSTSTGNPDMVEGAKLYNRAGASVSYTLPSTFSNAYLQVFDISGRVVKKITLTIANDIVDINPSEIGYGTFVYALYVDGQKADTLKKFVNRFSYENKIYIYDICEIMYVSLLLILFCGYCICQRPKRRGERIEG